MQAKVLTGIGLLLAFVAGMTARWDDGWLQATSAPAEEPVQIAPAPVLETRVQPVVYRAPVVAAQPAAQQVAVRPVPAPSESEGRSWEREVLIVGGSAGAGAAIGAAAGGKKGAAVGAISGGVAGLVYDIATRDRK